LDGEEKSGWPSYLFKKPVQSKEPARKKIEQAVPQNPSKKEKLTLATGRRQQGQEEKK